MPSIKIVSESEIRFTMAGPAEKLLMMSRRPPATDECTAAVAALETAVGEYLDAVHQLSAVDDAEEEYARKIRAEATAAVEEGRQPKAIKRPDFDDARLKLTATRDALLARAQKVRAALERQMEADSAAQGARDAARVPGLHEEALAAVRGAREALERLIAAREAAIGSLAGSPDHVVRPLPWHGHTFEALESVRTWLEDNRVPFTDLTIDVREVKPPIEERRAMAHAGGDYLEKLHTIELAEDFLITSHTRGYQPRLTSASYSL